ncbi:MAG: DUF1015 domain-containing protein [Desulforudis sp.]|nr:MAG: DUF1015 domain-containing protein [Desulforudis sp.]
MASIIPLRGVRYNPRVVPDLAQVVTPPYDVIDETAQNRYYDRNPYNVIRLEYGKTAPTDDAKNNRYTRAGETFSSWIADEVLVQDTQQCLYLYEQQFTVHVKTYARHGFFCGVRVEPYESGVVLPHEETLPKHKKDRLELMRLCRGNFSPIFGIYPEKEMVSSIIIGKAMQNDPDVSFTDELGQTHRMWIVRDHAVINPIISLMEQKRIFIADGHHRYETALAYSQEVGGPGLHNYTLMVLVNLYDPGLVVLPTHRLVQNPQGIAPETLISELGNLFEVTPASVEPENFTLFLDDLETRGKGSFGLYTGDGCLFVLSLKPGADLDGLMPADKSLAWRRLDVTILHSLILEKYLGIGSAERTDEGLIRYTREEAGALEKVDRGEFAFAFFMNPTGVDELVAVAEAGEKMPQKSTYFYPKLSTGLVINKF